MLQYSVKKAFSIDIENIFSCFIINQFPNFSIKFTNILKLEL